MDSPIIKEKMQSKRFFLFIVLFFSFISSLQPWFFWHIKAGIFYAIVFLSFYYTSVPLKRDDLNISY